jgi:hypothetical protein
MGVEGGTGAVDLFTRLEPRVETTLLTGAFGDFTTGAAS